jgi:hypothetical protein
VPELTDLCEDEREVLRMQLTAVGLRLRLSEKGVLHMRLLARRMYLVDASFATLASMLPPNATTTRNPRRGNKKKVTGRVNASNQDKGKEAAAAGLGEGEAKGQENVPNQADAVATIACTPVQTVSSEVSTRLL